MVWSGWEGLYGTLSGGQVCPRSPVWVTTGWVNVAERDGGRPYAKRLRPTCLFFAARATAAPAQNRGHVSKALPTSHHHPRPYGSGPFADSLPPKNLPVKEVAGLVSHEQFLIRNCSDLTLLDQSDLQAWRLSISVGDRFGSPWWMFVVLGVRITPGCAGSADGAGRAAEPPGRHTRPPLPRPPPARASRHRWSGALPRTRYAGVARRG